MIKLQLKRQTRFMVCLFLLLGVASNADAQDKTKQKCISFFLTPDVSTVDPNYAAGVNSKVNLLGLSLKYSNRNIDHRFYMSYGLLLDRNANAKEGLIDIRDEADGEMQNKTFDYKQSYSYIAPSIEMNYLVVDKETFLIGASAGLFLKYFLSQKLKFNLSDEEQKAKLSAADITNNYFYNNPGVMTSVWCKWKLNQNLFLHSGIDYSHDLNFYSSIPIFQKIGMSVGLTVNIGNMEN